MLMGQWGIADTEDCIEAANYFSQQNYIDKNRIVIMGGSAGGWTTYQCLKQAPGIVLLLLSFLQKALMNTLKDCLPLVLVIVEYQICCP
jgi:dienelactone hydrolase